MFTRTSTDEQGKRATSWRTHALRTVGGAAATVFLALSLAQPAAASEPAPSDTPPQLKAWLHNQVENDAPLARTPVTGALAQKGADAGKLHPQIVFDGGMRFIHYRGSFLLWTQDTFEWLWRGTTIVSSKGWQDSGYTFPNTASNAGIVRTLAVRDRHYWRSTFNVGAGVVTPWGAVQVYRTSRTDYYELRRAWHKTN